MRGGFVFVLCLLPVLAEAAESETARVRRQLDQRCETARAAKLRPIQEARIQECMDMLPEERGEIRTREQCETYWGDYGWGAGRAGMRGPRLYDDIPECIEAFKARQSEER
jgi:hypothetical protein